jgi:hypothetical protein
VAIRVEEPTADGWGARLHQALARRFGIDTRGLAAYRIAIATLVLVDLFAYRLPDLGAFYTDDGVLPRSLLAETFPVAASISLHAVTGAWAGQFALLSLTAAASAALLVGYRTRWAAILTWLGLASMQARNPHVINAGDTLVLATLFFGLFLPLGRRWSLDALHRSEEGSAQADVVASPASVGLLLQIVVVYATNAVFKTRSSGWTQGTAVRRIFALDDFTVRLGDGLAQVPELLVAANWVWFAALIASPLLVLLTGWPRAAYAGLLAALHLGMLATLMLGVFPLVSIAALLGVVPPVAWARRAATATPLRRRITASIPSRPRSPRSPWLPAGVRETGRDLVQSALAVLVVAGLLWHAMALGFVAKPAALDQAGRAAEHEWRMFAPASTTYGYVEAPAELGSGETVDALQGEPYTRQPPEDLADAYPSTLWHRYLKDLPEVTDAEQAALADHLCRQTAQAYDEPVQQLRLVFIEHEIRLDGPDPVERQTLHSQPC